MDSSTLKREAHEIGIDLVGVCDAVAAPHLDAYRSWLAKGYHGLMGYMERQAPLREHPNRLLPGVQSVVAVGLNYNQPNPVRGGFPRIARYALGRDYHKVLRGKLTRLGRWIEANCPDARWRVCVDSAPIFERDYARLAGLGWFGKNTCLIDTRRGSWFVLGLLLTTARFESDEPAEGGCGSCRRCVEACPTGAIVFEEERWQVDSRKCVSYLTIEVPAAEGDVGGEAEDYVGGRGYGVGTGPESVFLEGACHPDRRGAERRQPTGGDLRLAPNLATRTAFPSDSSTSLGMTGRGSEGTASEWTFGCDVCQEVCPFNQPRESQPLRATVTGESDFLARREWPGLKELAEIAFDDWDRLTRGSAVRRAGHGGLMLNARRNLSSRP